MSLILTVRLESVKNVKFPPVKISRYTVIHKSQAIHGGQRVCEENNELELEEKKRNLGEVFCGERTEF